MSSYLCQFAFALLKNTSPFSKAPQTSKVMKSSLSLFVLLVALLAFIQTSSGIILRSGLNVDGVAAAKKKNQTTSAPPSRQLEPEFILRSGLNVDGVANAKKNKTNAPARQLEPEIILRAGLNVDGVAAAKKKNSMST